jgi:hypothetical protein
MQSVAARFRQHTEAPAPQWQGSCLATRRPGDYAVKFADKEMQAGTKRPARRLISVELKVVERNSQPGENCESIKNPEDCVEPPFATGDLH